MTAEAHAHNEHDYDRAEAAIRVLWASAYGATGTRSRPSSGRTRSPDAYALGTSREESVD